MKLLGIEGEIIELEKPVRLAVLGCGSHVYRNILPSIRYIPDAVLTVFCDKNAEKAELFAKYHGVENWCSSTDELLKDFPEKYDALLVIIGFSPETGNPLYPEIIPQFLERGIPVWLEKPPAASYQQLGLLTAAAKKGNTFFQTGFKMMFAPALQQVKKLIGAPKFGKPQSFDVSYAVSFPSDVRDLTDVNARRFLDDIVHILSQIQFLFGCPYKMTTYRGGENDAVAVLEYKNGLTGVVRILGGISITGPAEYMRIVGNSDKIDNGTLIELKNAEEVVLHEPGNPGSYGRDFSFVRADGTHSHIWNPNLRRPLGALSLHSHALYGYINELAEFVKCVKNRTAPTVGGAEDTAAVMKMYDSFAAKNGVSHVLSRKIRTETLPGTFSVVEEFSCDNCHGSMFVKDGWTAKCESCGKTVQLVEFANRWPQSAIRKILKEAVTDLGVKPEVWEAHLRYNKGIAKENYQRCFVDLKLNKNAPTKYDYFIKAAKTRRDSFAKTEYEALSLLKKFAFVPEVCGKCNSKYVIQKYEEGTLLSTLMRQNPAAAEKYLLKAAECLAEFHKSSRSDATKPTGYVHGDIDPWQIIVKKNGELVFVDWEDFQKNENQLFDILNFVLMVGVIYAENKLSPAKSAENILYQKSDLTKLIAELLAVYGKLTGVTAEDIIKEIPAYAENRLRRLKKMARAAEGFIYSYLADVRIKDVVWQKIK